jgi:hypothetical protein
MKGPWNLLSRGPLNQIKRSPQPLDSYLCMVFCLMSLHITALRPLLKIIAMLYSTALYHIAVKNNTVSWGSTMELDFL